MCLQYNSYTSGNIQDEGEGRLEKPEEQEVSWEIMSPRDNTHGVWTTWLPKHDPNADNRHANTEGGGSLSGRQVPSPAGIRETAFSLPSMIWGKTYGRGIVREQNIKFQMRAWAWNMETVKITAQKRITGLCWLSFCWWNPKSWSELKLGLSKAASCSWLVVAGRHLAMLLFHPQHCLWQILSVILGVLSTFPLWQGLSH